MNIVDHLREAGFDRVIVLDGTECGVEADTVLLALWSYQAEREQAKGGAWIHPYYFASQKAYEAAAAIVQEYGAYGAALRDDIRLKPIFARLPGFSQGRNTLSYVDGLGSRFHVQTLTLTPGLPAMHHLEPAKHHLHCGDCRRCEAACPTGALEGGVFHRERCIRSWQMSGQPVPVEVRERMGNRLIGCDECQRCCPHNSAAEGETHAPVDLAELLTKPKQAAAVLRPQIGANLTIPNRVLSQACLMAGCSGNAALADLLAPLTQHPSSTVNEHAKWALTALFPSQS